MIKLQNIFKSFYKEFTTLFDKYYFYTAYVLAENAITRQYRDSFLGVLWSLIQPTVQVLIYSTIFSTIMRFPMENYVLYIVSSLLLWNFISQSLITSTNSILINGDVIKRCLISKTIFPIADVLRCLYNYLVAFFVMFAFVIIFHTHQLHWSYLLAPLYFLPILIIVMSLSIAISFLAPYVRDLGDFITMALNICFWFTPILYSIEIVPEQYRLFFQFNPIYVMIKPIIDLLYFHQIPSLFAHISFALVFIAAISLSYMVYRVCRRNFVYYL